MTRRSRSRASDGAPDPHASQLLASARRTLALALDDARDPALRAASLIDVVPHPDPSCLRLIVSAHHTELVSVRAALDRARGYLRGELANELDRRRTPEITFTVVAREAAS